MRIMLTAGVVVLVLLGVALAQDASNSTPSPELTPLSDGLVVWAERGDATSAQLSFGGEPLRVVAVRVPLGRRPRRGGDRETPDASPWPSPWRRTPPLNADSYPAQAFNAGVTGRVIVACAVRSDRRANCAAEREIPGEQGFGAAAVDIVTRALNLRLADAQDQVQNALRIPVDFEFGDTLSLNSGAADPKIEPTPDGHPLRAFYPIRAIDRGVQGAAELTCVIQPDRRLQCVVNTESPSGYNFGEAARRIWTSWSVSQSEIASGRYREGDRFYANSLFSIRTQID